MSFFDRVLDVAKSMGVKNFSYYKKWALDHLKKQLNEENQVTKAIEYCEDYLEKAYGVGTIRTWKGKKYIKGPDKKWRRYFEKNGRGTARAISNIMKEINSLENGDIEGLYAIIQKNAGRFRDENGNVLPEVQQIHDLVEKKQAGSENTESKLKAAKEDLARKTKAKAEARDKYGLDSKEFKDAEKEENKAADKRNALMKEREKESANKRHEMWNKKEATKNEKPKLTATQRYEMGIRDEKYEQARKDAEMRNQTENDFNKKRNETLNKMLGEMLKDPTEKQIDDFVSKFNTKAEAIEFIKEARTKHKTWENDFNNIIHKIEKEKEEEKKNTITLDSLLEEGLKDESLKKIYDNLVDNIVNHSAYTESWKSVNDKERLQIAKDEMANYEENLKGIEEKFNELANDKENNSNSWIEDNKYSIKKELVLYEAVKEGYKKLKEKIEKGEETEQEKHDNRSNAMLGNDNAKKDFEGTDLETVAEKYASDKELKNTIKKTDSMSFTSTDVTRYFLSGTYQEDGYKIATNAHILSMVKEDYPKEDEGKIKGNADQMKYIGKKIENLKSSLPEIESKLKKVAEEKGTGSEWYEVVKQDLDDTKKEIADLEEQVKTGNVNATFPNYKKAIPSMGNAKLIQQEGFEDFDKVLKTAMIAAAYGKKDKEIYPTVRVGNKVFNADYLVTVMAMAKKHGLNEIVTTEGEGRCVEFKGDNGSIVIVPMARADEVRDNEFNANTGEVKIEDKEKAEEFLSGGEKETRLTFMNNRSKYETKFDKDVMDIMNHFEKQKGLTPSKYQKNHNYIRVTRNPEHIGNEQNEDFKNAMNDLKDLYKDYQDFRTDIYNRRFEEGKENRDVSSKEIKTFFEDGIKKIKDKYGIKKSFSEQIEEISKAWSQNGKHLEVVTDKNGHTRKVWKKNSETSNNKSVKKETKEDSFDGFFATTGWDEHKIESAKRALSRKQKFDGRGEMTIKDFVDTVVKEGVLSSLSRTSLGDHGRSYGLNQYDFGDMVTYKYAKYKKEQKELKDKAPDEQKTISEIKNVVKDSLGTSKCEIQTFKQGGSTHYIVTMDLLDVKNKLPKDGMKEDIKAALKKNGVDVKEIWENVHPERWEFSTKIPAKYKFNFYVENNSSGMKKSFADRIADIMQKSGPAEPKHDLEYFKKWALSVLDKQKEEPEEEDGPSEETIVKALAYTEMIAKAGYPVGTIREWKGKKYIKVAPNQWKPKYDKINRGAKMSLTHLKKAVANCNSEEELYNLMNTNASRFRDENGHPLPEVQELHDIVSKRQAEMSNTGDSGENAGESAGNGGSAEVNGSEEKKEDKKTSYADKIAAIQKMGKKTENAIETTGSSGRADKVAENAVDDTVTAVKNAVSKNENKAKKDKKQVEMNGIPDVEMTDEEKENFLKQFEEEPENDVESEGMENVSKEDKIKAVAEELARNNGSVEDWKEQLSQMPDSFIEEKFGEISGGNANNSGNSGSTKDEEGLSNQAEDEQDKRIGGSALWDQHVRNAIKTGDVDKIKTAIAQVENEYNELSKKAKYQDEKEFLMYELKYRKRDAENAINKLQKK